jgi:hypothetical protein
MKAGMTSFYENCISQYLEILSILRNFVYGLLNKMMQWLWLQTSNPEVSNLNSESGKDFLCLGVLHQTARLFFSARVRFFTKFHAITQQE